jgi:hypothetical protein
MYERWRDGFTDEGLVDYLGRLETQMQAVTRSGPPIHARGR